MEITDKIKESFKRGSVITRIIYINIGLFIFLRLLNVLLSGGNGNFNLLNYFSLSGGFDKFLLKPWTIITFMFFDPSFFSVLFNAVFLYWIGKIFILYFDEKKLLGVYLLGGISGGIFFMMTSFLFPGLSENMIGAHLVGAAVPVISVIAAVAYYAPNYPIQLLLIGQIKMKHLALISILLYILGNSTANAPITIAYIGSALLGIYFAVNFHKGNDITKYFISFLDKAYSLFERKYKIKYSSRTHTYKNKGQSSSNKKVDQEEINYILDKVRESGYDSLTKEEKRKLFNIKK